METTFNCSMPDTAYFSSDERWWIARIRKLAEENPDEVKILRQPEENDGCIYATMPPEWLRRIGPKKRLAMSDEQKKANTERLRKAREAKARGEEEQDE